jgi:hypothetical protein
MVTPPFLNRYSSYDDKDFNNGIVFGAVAGIFFTALAASVWYNRL